MELTQGSETSAKYNLTPEKYPKEYMQITNSLFDILLQGFQLHIYNVINEMTVILLRFW
jgi:hypothetical protein